MVDLSKLETQTKKLIDLKNTVLRKHDSFVEYNVKNGTSLGFGLFKNGTIAVQRAFGTKGTKFPEHQHNEQEYIIVYEGEIEIFCDNLFTINNCVANDQTSPVILKEGDCAYFPPNTNHHLTYLQDSWIIGIIIPSVGGYPDAR